MSGFGGFLGNKVDIENVLLNPLRKPTNPTDLYKFCDNVLVGLGKYACVIIAYNFYKEVIREKYQGDSVYNILALEAVEKWIEQPNEHNRKSAGRIASTCLDASSQARTSRSLAHMVGRKSKRKDSFRYNLLGNHYLMTNLDLEMIITIIERSLWSLVGSKG